MSASSIARRLPVAVAAVAALCAALTACSGTASSSTSPGASPSVDPEWAKIRAELPASVRSQGELTVGTSAAYPPFDYYASDNKTVIGIDPDLASAVGEVLGIKLTFVAADFSSLIPGMAAGRYDLVWADAGDNPARQQQVDIIDYNRNTSLFLTSSDTKKVTKKTDVCGKTVAVEQGTTEVQYMQQQSTDCQAAGLAPVTVNQYPGLNDAVLAVKSGRAYATIANNATIGYTAKQSGGQLVASGPTYFSTLCGVLTPKGSPLTKPLQKALQQIVDDGRYAKILKKYGAEAAAIDTITVNGTPATPSPTTTAG